MTAKQIYNLKPIKVTTDVENILKIKEDNT